MDSLILCKFLRGVFDDLFAEWAELLRAVTGWDVDAAELRATARRIVLAKRVSTCARAPPPRTTRCPAGSLETPLELGSGRVAAPDRAGRGPWSAATTPRAAGTPRAVRSGRSAGLGLDPMGLDLVEDHNVAGSGLVPRDPADATGSLVSDLQHRHRSR